jgi:glycosyltransferase involved in cell wall biosynthesis
MDKISIIIPAHNEEHRIDDTLREYYHYFKGLQDQEKVDFEIVVVLNGCNDNTADVVKQIMTSSGNEIRLLDLTEAGKGLAIIAGFKDALSRPNDYIGFVDADMATEPYYFYELYEQISDHDGVIASRYMPASEIYPPRPLIKKWGRKLIYNQVVHLLFGLRYADAQCGAKLFKRSLIETVVDQMSEGQWAFDVELLYLAKKHGFDVVEVPTVWTDKAGSKLQTFSSGIGMLRSLWKLKKLHN